MEVCKIDYFYYRYYNLQYIFTVNMRRLWNRLYNGDPYAGEAAYLYCNYSQYSKCHDVVLGTVTPVYILEHLFPQARGT